MMWNKMQISGVYWEFILSPYAGILINYENEKLWFTQNEKNTCSHIF